MTNYNLCWGTTSGNYNYTNVYPATQTTAAISNLASLAVYFFAVQAVDTNGNVSDFSNEQGYTNGPSDMAAPLAVTQPATGLNSNGATLNASVTPQGAETMVYFNYGASAGYGSTTPASDAGSGTNALPVSSGVSGLSPATTYHFQAIASNSLGTASGGDLTFTTTAAAALLATQPATNISSNSATLNALVTPQGAETTVYFSYGASTNYGSATPANDVGSGTNALLAATGVTGLLPGTTYHVQALASNSFGTTPGGDVSFRTAAMSPLVAAQPATAINSNSATLNASVTPQGAETTVYFAFGTDSNYGSTNVVSKVGRGNCTLTVSNGVTGLLPGTADRVQARASNCAGTASAADAAFTTAGADTPTVANITTNLWGIPPILSMGLNNGQASLTIAGTVGATLTIMGTTNDLSMVAWSAVTNVTLTDIAPTANANAASPSAPQNILTVAFVPGTATLPVGASNASMVQFFVSVMSYDYIILADQVLPDKGYTPRLMVVNMPGILADDVCYVNETANFIHCVRTNSALQLFASGSTIRDVATTLANSLSLDWTSASEFTYSNGLCQILATAIETEPPSSDPVAGQSPPGPPIVIDF